MFYKKGVLKDFAKFTGKHLRQSLFLIKLQILSCLRPATLLKKRLCHRCFPVNFTKCFSSEMSEMNDLIKNW